MLWDQSGSKETTPEFLEIVEPSLDDHPDLEDLFERDQDLASLRELSIRVGSFYTGLVNSGVPEELASHIAHDWFIAAVGFVEEE